MKLKLKPTKKACTVILAASFALQPTVAVSPVFADNMDNSEAEVSSLGIDINLDFPTPGDTFHVTLDSLDGNGDKKEYDFISNDKGSFASGEIKDIPVGKYALTITADSYATYTQEITISKGITTKIELNNSKRKNEWMKLSGSELYGVMAIGDVNADGNVDEKDSNAIMEAIENGVNKSKYDLNNDNSVDIADLAYITLNYGKNVIAKPLNIVSSENVKAEEGNNTVVKSGNPNDLTENSNNFVQFSTVNNQPISSENAIELSLEINQSEETKIQKVNGILIKPPVGSLNLIESGIITVEDEDGNEYTFDIGKEEFAQAVGYAMARDNMRSPQDIVTIESDGSVIINIGTQIAIKKVTIKVTGASTNLVDIAKVEFVNNMEDRIPEPDFSIPEDIVLEQLSAGENPSFSVTWEPQVNVTGYQVQVSSNGNEIIKDCNSNSITITGLGSGKLATYEPYTVRVRSTNGNWKSPYSKSAEIILKPDSAPPAPEYVKADGQAESIKVSWRKMRDTQYYSLFYREKGVEEYTEIKNINTVSYVIANLKPKTIYEVYVVGHNEIGSSPKSDVNQAMATAAENVIMPKYKLINTSNGVGVLTSHIKEVQVPSGANLTGDEYAVVDDDQSTYTVVNDWDTGVVYSNHSNPIVTLDQKYTLDTISFAPSVSQPYRYTGAKIRYIDDNGNWSKADNCSISQKRDINNNIYYTVTSNEPITSDTFQLCITTGYSRMISISEMKFYYYDDLAHNINDLYEDAMHLQLKSDVTFELIDELENKLNTKDSVSGELHPDYESLKKEIEYARELLNTGALAEIIQVDTSVTPKSDSHTDFAMSLTNYQPLGTVAKAGDEIIIYVGSENESEGTKTSLNLIATQNHGEAAQWQSDMGQLSVGRNVITVPNISSSAISENGGSLYIAWNGNANARQYSVRVSGGESIPVLNVAGKTGAERTEMIKIYIEKLEKHVSELHQKHAQNHKDNEYRNDCISNYTEIVMDNMMYSVPATQVLAGLKGGNAEKLETAISAMEQQVDLFYQHKGYSKNVDSNSKNKYPSQRLNIRYHTMFTGAFMYAGGKHIGIEYGSVPGLFSISPITADDKGKKIDGNLTGWGIAHEIGHVINSRSYAVAEVTNNYFSMLATQTQRTNYEDVYKEVTKGSVGQSSNVFTTLGMYWQLHMFYDNYYDYKMFENNEEQLENLFYARVDSYVRNPDLAPSNGIKLTLSGSSSDKFIRLACAAAEKNLTPFFDAWGLSYNEETKKYAEQFEAEEHKIQYFNNDAREYCLSGKAAMSSGTKVTAEISTAHEDNVVYDNKITLSLENNGDKDAMLGYEIIRNGEPVAFVLAKENSYTDIITTGNNKVYEYQVVGYDKFLNKTEPVSIEPVKVKHRGEIDRDGWIIETNMSSDDDEMIKADGDSGYCEDTYISAISNIIGKGTKTGYSGKTDSKNAEFIVSLGGKEQVTALRYDGDAADFTVYVSEDKENWTEVKKGSFTGGKDETVYFNQPDSDKEGYMYIYKADYVKVVFNVSSISINDFNILGPTSDNVELLNDGIGILQSDFVYDKNTNASIPANSIIFTGVYKGNPAYNVVKLLDENGNIVDGSQVIMAENPDNGELGNVSEGIWIYWIEPQDIPEKLYSKVKAELYRVDDAFTMENERIVSDTLFVDVPSVLPNITINDENTTINELSELSEISETDNTDDTDNIEKDSYNTETNTDTDSYIDEYIEEDTSEVLSENDDTDIIEGEIDNNLYIPEKLNEEAENISLFNVISDDVQVVRTAVVSSDINEDSNNNFSGFVFTKDNSDNKKALMQLNLGDETMDNTIAFQTAFKVSEPKVTSVSINWSDIVNSRAVLKECRYDAKKEMVFIYIVANEDLLDNNSVTLGNIQMKAANGVTEASLNLNPNSTVMLSEDFNTKQLQSLVGDVTLEVGTNSSTNKPDDGNDRPSSGNRPSGGGSGSSSSKKNVEDTKTKDDNNNNDKNDNNDKNEENKQQSSSLSKIKDVSEIFADVSKSAWYYNAVKQAYENEWFKGTSDFEFSPNATMTRGMFVTVLGRFAKASGKTSSKFTDVPTNAYYAEFVSWAAENGIVNGVSDTKFSPNSAVTREQLAVIVYNYLKFKGVDLEFNNNKVNFTDDSQLSSWSKDAVYYMQQTGIINGMPDGSFRPRGMATRAEVATILINLDNKLK